MDVEEEEEDDEVEAEDVKEEDRSQDRETHFFWEPAQSKCTWIFDKSHFVEIYGKMPDPNPGHGSLCEPAQLKRTWTFEQSHLCGNLQNKCRTPIPGTAFCLSLRSRNARGHFTRAIFCGNLQGIGRTRMVPPRLNTVRTPSVWPHCLGNKVM